MTTVEAIAKRTKQLMIEKNICQKELEIKSKISHSVMSKMLLWKYKYLDFKIVFKLSGALGISVCEFLDDELFDLGKLELKYKKPKTN